MKKPWVTIVLAAALSLAVTAPVAAASPFMDASQDKGSSAWADAGACTEDVPDVGDYTCEYTNAQVFDGRSRYNGERFRDNSLCVSFGMSFYDASAGTYEDSWTGGCLEGADIYIDKGLASASGAGIVPTESLSCIWDEDTDEGSCTDPAPAGDVAVDLAWTGIPPVLKSSYRGRDQDGDCTSTYFSKGSFSEAAVSGTIDGVATSFDWAQISSGKSRYTFSCHK